MTLTANLTTPSGVPIAERAMLVDLTIATWSGTKHDKKVSDEVAQAHNASSDAGRYMKRLLSKNQPLTELQQIASAARVDHYAKTLPWLDTGQRILSSDIYLDYATTMRKHEDAFYAARDRFVAAYPALKARAAQELNGLFNSNDYPPVSEIERRFRFGYNVMPLPTATDFRVDLGADEIARIQAQIERDVSDALADATHDVYERIGKTVGHMASKLRGYKVTPEGTEGIFRDSLVQNVRELANLLPALNVMDDPNLAAIGQRISDELTHFDADVLRESQAKRVETAQAAERILADISAYIA